MTNATATTIQQSRFTSAARRCFEGRPFMLGALLCTLFASTFARGQEIPRDIVSSPAKLTPDQQKAVEAYVDPFVALLKGDEANKIRDARNGIIKPLQSPVVGVAFRTFYSQTLAKSLPSLVSGDRPLNAINAIRIGAELATTEGFDLIDKGLSSSDPVVRVAAASAAGRAFVIAGKATSIVVPKRLLDMTTSLGKALETDEDSNVMDSAAESLVTAFKTTASAEVRNGAVLALSRGISSRTQKIQSSLPDTRTLSAILRSGLALRDELTIANAGNHPALPSEAIKAIGEVGGDMIAMIARLVAANAIPTAKAGDAPAVRRQKDDARRTPAQIVGAGEQILSLIADRTEPIRTNFAELIRESTVNSDAKFLLDVKQLIGPGGRLTRPPFNLPGTRFAI